MTKISQTGRLPKMLLIDDNRGDAALIEIAFEMAQVAVELTITPSAERGLSFLRREGEFAAAARPDLVLLDLNLPCMSGLALLARLKSDPKLLQIPVIILSSSSADEDVVAAYAHHANGFVTKPYSLDGYETFVGSMERYWFNLVEAPVAT